MKKAVFLVALAALCWLPFRTPKAKWRGWPAHETPVQTTDKLPKPYQLGNYTITPLANYRITAVVLGAERYRFDPAAKLAPVDLALGWGPMSLASVINDLKFSQSGRWYEYSYRAEPPAEPEAMARNSANTHCIPADERIRKELLKVRRHELVTLTGHLVEVRGTDGYVWRSSLTRDDTGGHACELLYVTSVSRRSL